MIDSTTKKRLINECKKLFKFPMQNIIAIPNENDILTWHFLLYNLKDSPFENGFYIGHIFFPSDYPF